MTLDSGTNHSETQFPPLKTGDNNDTQVLIRASVPDIFTSGQAEETTKELHYKTTEAFHPRCTEINVFRNMFPTIVEKSM